LSPADLAVDLNELFSEVLNPVAKSALKKAAQVGLPAGLDLDAVINEPQDSDSDEEDLDKIDWGSTLDEKPSYTTPYPNKALDSRTGEDQVSCPF